MRPAKHVQAHRVSPLPPYGHATQHVTMAPCGGCGGRHTYRRRAIQPDQLRVEHIPGHVGGGANLHSRQEFGALPAVGFRCAWPCEQLHAACRSFAFAPRRHDEVCVAVFNRTVVPENLHRRRSVKGTHCCEGRVQVTKVRPVKGRQHTHRTTHVQVTHTDASEG